MKAVVHANLITPIDCGYPLRGKALGEVQTIDDAAVLLDDTGKILAVGETTALKSEIDSAVEVIDAKGRLMTPGLIDCHTHFAFVGDRSSEFHMRCAGASYQDIAASGGGIKRSMQQLRAANLEDLTTSAIEHLNWMRACGTVACEGKTGYGLSLEAEQKTLLAMQQASDQTGIPVSKTLLALHAIPPQFDSESAYTEYVLKELIPKLNGMFNSVDIFVENGYFSSESLRSLKAAISERTDLRVHLDQFSDQGGVSLAVELGARSVDHLEYTGAAGIAALANSNTFATLLPTSVFALGKSKYAAAREMIDAGCAVCLATDFNPGSSPSPSLPFAMSLACLQMHLTANEALNSCTLNAAYNLGIEKTFGSIESGKSPGLIVWDCNKLEELAYWIGRNLVAAILA